MGEAKRKKQERAAWPDADRYNGSIDLHVLPAVASINGARIRELTGDDTIPETTQVILRAFRAVVGERTFHVGFCLGDGEAFSAVGIAVIERLSMEAPGTALHIVPIVHEDIAWDIVTRHLRSFTGQTLLFVFPDSDVYDAGTAEISYSKHIRQFDPSGGSTRTTDRDATAQDTRAKGSDAQSAAATEILPGRGCRPRRLAMDISGRDARRKGHQDSRLDGRRNYAHEFPEDIIRWVGGDRIAIVQVDSPVGINRRSSLDLTHRLAKDFDGVIHWARDTETFQSILKSFIRLDLDSVSPPDLPEGWEPEIVILAANGGKREEG